MHSKYVMAEAYELKFQIKVSQAKIKTDVNKIAYNMFFDSTHPKRSLLLVLKEIIRNRWCKCGFIRLPTLSGSMWNQEALLGILSHFHFISCLHAPSGAAHEGRKLLLLCQLASPTTHYACYFGRSQLPGPRPQAAAAAGPQQRPHPNPRNPNQPTRKPPTPGRLRCAKGTQELRQNPNLTIAHPNGPPNPAPQPPPPPPPGPTASDSL